MTAAAATGSASDGCAICRALPPSSLRPSTAPAPRDANEWLAVDRVHAALLGVAIGDALGRLAVEGRRTPRRPSAGELRVGRATQLTLFLAEALVHMYARYRARGIGPAWELARMGLQRWSFAQGEDARPPENVARVPGTGRWPNGWLVREHVLHERVSGFEAVQAGLRSTVDPCARGRRGLPGGAPGHRKCVGAWRVATNVSGVLQAVADDPAIALMYRLFPN